MIFGSRFRNSIGSGPDTKSLLRSPIRLLQVLAGFGGYPLTRPKLNSVRHECCLGSARAKNGWLIEF